MRFHRVALAAALVPLLAACGSDKPDVTPASESLPACADVWVAGETLAGDYEGCVDEDGVLNVPEIQDCTENDDQITTFDARFFSLLGGEISDAGFTSTDYDQVFASCFGDDW
jgi:hypothetical protein